MAKLDLDLHGEIEDNIQTVMDESVDAGDRDVEVRLEVDEEEGHVEGDVEVWVDWRDFKFDIVDIVETALMENKDDFGFRSASITVTINMDKGNDGTDINWEA